MFVNPGRKNPVKISAGIQDENFRAGVKFYDLKASDKLSFNPYVYVDTSGGNSIGSDIEYKLTNNFNLNARVEHNHKDILESGVKDKGNGVNATLGFKLRF